MGKIIAICNQKGGTGKTTTAINLSVYLALNNQRVLLIDLDPQANATSGLGTDKAKVEKSSYHLILDDEIKFSEVILKTKIENFWLVPANVDLSGAEVELVGLLGREYRLKKTLEIESNNFDFILIDCPPSLGLLTINALAASNSVFIPVQCEYYALEGLTQLLKTIELIKKNINSSLQIEGVLLTMADYRTNLTREVIQETRNYFKDKVYQTVIPRNIRLTEAPSFGQPIALYDKDSLGAHKYQELAQEVLRLPITNIEELKAPEIKENPNEINQIKEEVGNG